MERRIRADKRECMMLQETGDEEGLKKAAGKLRADKDRYKDFCKETGLGAHNENTQVYGYDRSKSMKTVWAEIKASAAQGVPQSMPQNGSMATTTPNTMQKNIGGNTLTGGSRSGIIKQSVIDNNTIARNYTKKYHDFTVAEIEEELNKSEVGKHVLEYIKADALAVILDYDNEDLPPNALGEYFCGAIILNMKNIYNVRDLVKTLIHETTHAEIDSEVNTLKEEVYCKIQELRHDREPTYSDIRQIVRDVNELYCT